ncbi:Monoamine oxidase [Pseudonocardia sp. Ae406_Ps2]|uniref:primary-amine oxidase n=1 Tax=unclassified Pseudonocardia TaxID=2619320 RepID=UPI0009619A04|nr:MULTISPECIES: primary-amine oxidase [unclassified Pseudonocardia]OLL99854.1 Monoamine oxidase [Pseudonocardia sp. Ae331_Ps2]OLM02396.1 Monoamine oxidase [Pseudonocardia sp. Ae406_Ps2]OLM12768.1 Monoamine oxidase [Pseudonocardia sp. Ae505_Ps2]OLM23967.1 Monoamine oxidase [Pseudonocardia sp. Ae706_Ps2]OLM30081.1 Monoamine oxidase [Pseudonocardia sp. Ae717_Ps2]
MSVIEGVAASGPERTPGAGSGPRFGRQTPPSPAQRHWTEPLAESEIAEIVDLVKADPRIGEHPRFWGVSVDEHRARDLPAGVGRPVRSIVMNPDAHAAWEVTGWTSGVDRPASLQTWTPVDARRPGISSEEARMMAQACRDDPGMRAALARRGITDPSLVWVDPESITGFEPPEFAGRRLSWGAVWHREHPEDNGYARPVPGLVPIVDMETFEVLRIEDHDSGPPTAEAGNYRSGDWGPDRVVAPLEIVQPDGPGFTVDGHLVRWQNWSFRVGFTHREGMVLHDVRYLDGDRERTVLRRAAVNEMYVPYLDPDPTAYRKNFFDWGEYGAGPLTASLALGCDCLGEIRYLDAAVLGGHGEPRTVRNAVCLHEEDASILWKHVNTRTGHAEVRRSRKMVVSSFATVANYDYGFYWSFHQDGTIDLEIKLTGIMSVTGLGPDGAARHGRRVGADVQASNHQHYFGLRLDTAVDGPRNRLSEIHAEVEPDPELDPYGNACRMVRTPITSEAAGARSADPSRAVHWLVESTERTNRFGDPTGYRLVLPNTTRLFARPGSVVERKAPFVSRALWASAYAPDERFIAGEYPNQGPLGEDGVHVWQRADRRLDDAELVLWPVVGVHHDPRPEEWPVMAVHRIGMRMEPDGFFDRNPSLDLPAPAPARSGDGCCH